jgi:hypothetical protein
MTFTRLLSVLKADITLCQPVNVSTTEAPAFLPPTIATFVSNATGIEHDAILKCWVLLNDDVWALPRPELSADEEDLFRMHGWALGISKSFRD